MPFLEGFPPKKGAYKRYSIGRFVAGCYFWWDEYRRSAPHTAEAHIAAAKAAAGREHTGLFNSLCTPPTGPRPARGDPPPQSEWHAEPAKVFDNLYVVGQTEYSSWDVTTSNGIIIVDALWDYSVEDEIVNGLKKLGLDESRSNTCFSAMVISTMPGGSGCQHGS